MRMPVYPDLYIKFNIYSYINKNYNLTKTKNYSYLRSLFNGIPNIDVMGRIRCADTTTLLNPHPDACQYFDHFFTSPTYKNFLKTKIDDYIERQMNL